MRTTRAEAGPATAPAAGEPGRAGDDAPAPDSRQALLAGLGSTGSLIAAIAVAATVVTGTIAFTSWPGPPSGQGDAEVRLALPDVSTAVTAAVASTTADAFPRAGGGSAAAASAGSPGGTPPRPGSRLGSGGADPAPTSRGVTSPVASAAPADGQAEEDAEERASLGDATELAGKSIGTGVANGTGEVAGGIKDHAPITAGAVVKAGEVSGEAVAAAAEVVAEALRVLPLERGSDRRAAGERSGRDA